MTNMKTGKTGDDGSKTRPGKGGIDEHHEVEAALVMQLA